MKKIFTIFTALSLSMVPMLGQELDRTYIFVDADGNEVVDGTTVTRDLVEYDDEGNEVIYAGIFVQNLSAGANDYIQIHYTINQIDNGTFQICYPSACIAQTEPGAYVTSRGQTPGTVSMQTEWFPVADGVCDVTYQIEILAKQSGFPVKYNHKGYGSTITVHYVKGGSAGNPGDVNGDGEVNIADVNGVIDMILSARFDKSADVNGDGEVNIGDVNAVIDLILNAK